MSADSPRDLIVAAIRVSSQPLDDDHLAARRGISPRQTVNRICRALERAGIVQRRHGPDGKIVNEWLGEPGQEPANTPSLAGTAVVGTGTPAGPAVSSAGAVPAGDSAEQRGAERVMLDLLGAQLGRELNPATITRPGSASKSTAPTLSARSWPSAGRTRARPRARKGTRSWPMPSSWPGSAPPSTRGRSSSCA
jgi:hypothetical protein